MTFLSHLKKKLCLLQWLDRTCHFHFRRNLVLLPSIYVLRAVYKSQMVQHQHIPINWLWYPEILLLETQSRKVLWPSESHLAAWKFSSRHFPWHWGLRKFASQFWRLAFRGPKMSQSKWGQKPEKLPVSLPTTCSWNFSARNWIPHPVRTCRTIWLCLSGGILTLLLHHLASFAATFINNSIY